MKYTQIIFWLALCFPLLSQSQGMRGVESKDPEYVKYEQEDVSKYRQKFDFQLPATEVMVTPVETPQYQSIENLYFQGGRKVYIEADDRLATFIQAHKEIGGKKRTGPGFRIQIFAGASRDGANRVKSSFLSRYNGMASYLIHVAPTYRIRVGDFIDKSDAQIMCNKLKESFPGAFVVPDQVLLPKYKGSDYIPDR